MRSDCPSTDDVHLQYDLQREVCRTHHSAAHRSDSRSGYCRSKSAMLEVSLLGAAHLPSLAQLLNYAYAPPVRRIAFEDSNFLVVNKPFDLQVDGARPLTLEKMIREARC